MALTTSRLLGLALAATVLGAAPSLAVDARIEKARQIRDEILEKRKAKQPAGAAVRPDLPPADNPFQAEVTAARERVAAIDLQIEEKRRQSLATAAPRDKLQAKSDEIALEINAIHERNRARVEAIYRSAKLGAGAAGWHPEPARSARLSRYLASIAADQQKKLEVVEVEHGSVIASLDKARAEDASAQNELRALDADRNEAMASLDRALADAGTPRRRVAELTPEEAEAEALARENAAALSGTPLEASDSALAVQRAMAQLQARTGSKPVGELAGVKPVGELAGIKPIDGSDAVKPVGDLAAASPNAAATNGNGQGGDFAWPTGAGAPATGSDAEAKALEEAKAALEARRAAEAAEKAAMAEEEKLAAAARVAEAKVIAEAKAAAKAAEEKKAAEEAEKKAAEASAAAEAALRAKAEAEEKKDAHGTARELEDGPAVLAPSPPPGQQVASVPAQPGGEPASDAPASDDDKPKKPNLLSRMFGGDRAADEFAAERGKLPPPVAGKVVANYGQQHKSGATYRGVILRAGHSAPIKAVAGGKVSFAGNVPGLGNTVIVSHGGRYHTVYARLGSLEVKEGQSVGTGTEVGTLPADDADMHFELRDQGKAVDPVPWLKGGIPGAAQ